ncbi:UvrABC system protein C [Vulcanimicrobium alpinum]|uniref:UvrABC system protein C n=1 Tax=Vulcanimicrobium alpinum TaxID=3016050 RepID=A0AAN1XVL9_UNVUL|nr:excinuclease ABC subunit UvrC [Vulcanimicrobium alpinum]BDE05815.1 UvrABC system protein C [Vulcanimicrobium alpinum]
MTEPSRLERTLSQLSDQPGVYMMLGEDGRILYIGKAVSLRNRVRSYFQDSAAHPYRTLRMVQRVVDVRTIVVTNEIEALILEANLIKRHQPPFNVRLRDDKRFPYLKVTSERFPRVVFTRVVKDDGGRYFGPYTNAAGLRELIDLIRIVFPLRTCREPIDGKRKRPCLQYHIKRCLAPCVGYQSEDDYDKLVDEVNLFLEGHYDPLIERLQGEMSAAAEHYNFEAAARLRDRIIAVRRTIEAQKVVWRSRIDVDLMAFARAQGQACVQVFMVRDGKLLGQEYFILEGAGEQSDAELFSQFLKQFYTARTGNYGMNGAFEAEIDASPLALRAARDQQAPVAVKARARRRAGFESAIPKEIQVEAMPEDASVIEAWLTEIKAQRVRIVVPQRGERREYLALVKKNAEQNLRAFLVHQEATEHASASALTELASGLDLPEPPHRIECYDISNIQGTNSVASMVVFIEGRPKKSDYRHFNIQAVEGPNDFASMQETLRRRLRYLRQDADRPPVADGDAATRAIEAQARKRERFHEKPDLLLIDGGKGQLNAVAEVMRELDMWGIPVAGLAKENEWLYLPGNSEPIVLPPNSAGLHLVMRIRDEAHRFAIAHHRSKRGKAMTKSVLDTLAGVGPVRKKRLLAAFGSVRAIRNASVDEIAAVKGMTPALASQVKEALSR